MNDQCMYHQGSIQNAVEPTCLSATECADL